MPEGQTSKVIAIVDDNESIQESLCDLIESGGFEARCFGSAKAFLESDLHGSAACLIVDVLMPKMSGLELQVRLRHEECNVPIIFIAAFDDAETRTQAMKIADGLSRVGTIWIFLVWSRVRFKGMESGEKRCS